MKCVWVGGCRKRRRKKKKAIKPKYFVKIKVIMQGQLIAVAHTLYTTRPYTQFHITSETTSYVSFLRGGHKIRQSLLILWCKIQGMKNIDENVSKKISIFVYD